MARSLPSAMLALNATLRRYHLGPGGITSSSHVFNGREPTVVLIDNTPFNIANTVMIKDKAALNDTLSYINTEANGTFDIRVGIFYFKSPDSNYYSGYVLNPSWEVTCTI